MSTEAGEYCASILGDEGPFRIQTPDFAPRVAQQSMAVAVAEALNATQALAVEAGTGVGKTFGYLVPVLLKGERTIISTGTKNLQDQLHNRDLPRVQRALGVVSRTAILKGRNNYVCLHRLERARSEVSTKELVVIDALKQWCDRTRTGELTEFAELPSVLRGKVTSTPDNCLGLKCPEFESCYVVKARRLAQEANVVVVNHHLLLSDFRLKGEGFSVLPDAQAVIVDEAHQLCELGSQFFGERVSTQQLSELVRDTSGECTAFGDMPFLAEAAQGLADCVYEAEAAFVEVGIRQTREQFEEREDIQGLHDRIEAALNRLHDALQDVSSRNADLSNLEIRAQRLIDCWKILVRTDESGTWVHWIEPTGRGGSWNATPVDTAVSFGNLFNAYPGSWIFTSATLSALPDFSDFRRAVGLSEIRTLRLDSPFDYALQTRLYLPTGIPDPSDPSYADCIVSMLQPILRASDGGAFILCTSYRILTRIADLLRRSQAPGNGPVFVQGELAKETMLAEFSAAGNAVLVATNSFWEGVDVRGMALRVVVIDKLPFAAPGDPVTDAREAAIAAAGGNAFRDYRIPRVILALRQGIGRLIRDTTDRGLVILCDPRLHHRGYAGRILSALPSMTPVSSSEEACEWIRKVSDRC